MKHAGSASEKQYIHVRPPSQLFSLSLSPSNTVFTYQCYVFFLDDQMGTRSKVDFSLTAPAGSGLNIKKKKKQQQQQQLINKCRANSHDKTLR